MVLQALPSQVRRDLTKFLDRIDQADISKEDKHRLLVLWVVVLNYIVDVERKHNG